MKRSETIYTSTDAPLRSSTKINYAWVKSIKPIKPRENGRDSFILRLGRTKPSQIGYEIEEIDQETQQSIINLRYAHFCNERLKKIYEEELKELSDIETKLVVLSKETNRKSHKREPRLVTNINACLVKNLNRALFSSAHEISQKTNDLENLQKSSKLLENEKSLALAQELQCELDQLTEMRQLHHNSLVEDRHLREKAVSKNLLEKQHELKELEKKLDTIEEKILKFEQICSNPNSKFKNLQNKVKIDQQKVKKLRNQVELAEKESETLENECDKLEGVDQIKFEEVPEIAAFFLYVKIYTEEHKLGTSFIRNFFKETCKRETTSKFEELTQDYWGMVNKTSIFRFFSKISEEFCAKENPTELLQRYQNWSKRLSIFAESADQAPIASFDGCAQLIEWINLHITSHNPAYLLKIITDAQTRMNFHDLHSPRNNIITEAKQNGVIDFESQSVKKDLAEERKKVSDFSDDFEKECLDN